jgi:hypothetical protein
MYETEKVALEEYAEKNGSTAEQGLEQEDGSVVVLRSVQGETCEEFALSAEEREEKGWPPLQPDEPQD